MNKWKCEYHVSITSVIVRLIILSPNKNMRVVLIFSQLGDVLDSFLNVFMAILALFCKSVAIMTVPDAPSPAI